MEAKWHSVKDSLPETWSLLGGRSGMVLVHFRRPSNYDGKEIERVAVGNYCGGTRWNALDCCKEGHYRYIDVEADYWMPIPPAPKGGAA